MSYSDESYRRTPSSKSPFFRPTPRPTPPPEEEESKVPKTKRAAQVRSPVATKIIRPKGKINLAFVFDTSGSMGVLRDNLKEKMEYFCDELKNLLPDLVGGMEITFVGVSDHCDGRHLLQVTAFSSDIDTLKNNIASIVGTGGGDTPEAYECLFKEMNGWDIEGTNTVFVLVADSVPHGAGYSDDEGCPDRVDWRRELTDLKKKVRAFYFVSCATHNVIKRIQRLLPDDEKHFIELEGNFTRLTNVVHAIISQEVGELDKYLGHLQETRGAPRATEIKTLLKTQNQ